MAKVSKSTVAINAGITIVSGLFVMLFMVIIGVYLHDTQNLDFSVLTRGMYEEPTNVKQRDKYYGIFPVTGLYQPVGVDEHRRTMVEEGVENVEVVDDTIYRVQSEEDESVFYMFVPFRVESEYAQPLGIKNPKAIGNSYDYCPIEIVLDDPEEEYGSDYIEIMTDMFQSPNWFSEIKGLSKSNKVFLSEGKEESCEVDESSPYLKDEEGKDWVTRVGFCRLDKTGVNPDLLEYYEPDGTSEEYYAHHALLASDADTAYIQYRQSVWNMDDGSVPTEEVAYATFKHIQCNIKDVTLEELNAELDKVRGLKDTYEFVDKSVLRS